MSMTIGGACIGCGACIAACPVDAITGQKKAMHRIDPALCIECGSCGRVCPSAAVVDGDGKTVARSMPRARWPKPRFEAERCISCGCCADICPARCLDRGAGEPGGFGAIPFLARPAECVSCGWCAEVCPTSCIALGVPVEAAR